MTPQPHPVPAPTPRRRRKVIRWKARTVRPLVWCRACELWVMRPEGKCEQCGGREYLEQEARKRKVRR